jgi:hypothetical protein
MPAPNKPLDDIGKNAEIENQKTIKQKIIFYNKISILCTKIINLLKAVQTREVSSLLIRYLF